jgi:hypothetical protein
MDTNQRNALVPYGPQLGALRCELTQHAIDLALQEFNTSYTIEKYVEQQRGAFYIKIGGPVTLSNFGLSIERGKGIPSVDITNEFKIYYRIPLIGEKQFESLPFHISAPTMRVSLHSAGSKGYATLHLDRLKIELLQTDLTSSLERGRLRDILALVKQSISLIVEELTRAINDKLQREPFQLFDLTKVPLPLGEDKSIDVSIVLDEFAFEDDRVVASLLIYGTSDEPRISLPKPA